MSGKVTQIRDLVITIAVVVAVLIFGYRELFPKPAATNPDRIEAAAAAYLTVQPTSLEGIANGIEGGFIKPEGIAEAIKNAHLPAATELQNALKDAGNTPTAFRRAATAMHKGIR